MSSFFDRLKRTLGASGEDDADEAGDRLKTYRRLLKMIEMQVPALAGHSTRVARYAELIARGMGLPEKDIGDIRMAAELHDVGETRVHGSVLAEEDDLTPQQIELIRKHPVLGAEMLQDVPALRRLAPVVKYHHERWDGSGYPDRLKGTDIPLGARIIAVADVFDALTSERPYRRAYASADAVRHLVRHSGKLYDPEVVEVLASRWSGDGEVQELVEEDREYIARRQIPEGTAVSGDSAFSRWTRIVMDLPEDGEE